MLDGLQCPFTNKLLYCGEKECGDCPVRAQHRRKENDRIAEGVREMQRCVNSGAAGFIGSDD